MSAAYPHRRRHPAPETVRQAWKRHASSGLLWLLLAAALITGCGQAQPAPAMPSATPQAALPPGPITEQPLPYEPTATGPAQPAPEPTETPSASAAVGATPLLPGIELSRQASFLADPPAQAALYRLESWPALSAEQAVQLAARLGVSGGVYLSPSFPAGEPAYIVSGKGGSVEFLRSAQQWLYQADPAAPGPLPSFAPASDTQIAGLAERLKAAGALDFPYQLLPESGMHGRAQLAQLAGEAPLLFETGGPAGVEAFFGPDGQPGHIETRPLKLAESGSYPILSDRQAWQSLIGGEIPAGMLLHASGPGVNHLWRRAHPVGQRAELFGRLQVLMPNDPAAAPRLLLQGVPLAGDLAALVQANNNHLWQVWGQMENDSQGSPQLKVESWQASAFLETYLDGRVERQGGQVYLQTGEQRVLLPDAPADLADGAVISAGGVLVDGDPAALEWWALATLAAVSSGGPGFQPLSVGGQKAYSEAGAAPSPVKPGERVEGETGQVVVILHQYADGSQRSEVNLALEASAQRPESLLAAVDAPLPPGIASFQRLPVRVWGQFVPGNGSLPVLQIERLEPLYPGLQAQAWLGLLEPVTLTETQILRFTSQDGQEYALADTPTTGEMGPLPGSAGEAVIIEGYAPPGQSYAGLPVLNALLIAPAEGRTSLEGYSPQALRPAVVQEAGSASGPRRATVESITLVYVAPDLRYATLAAGAPLAYAQPAWRFAGHFDDGAAFEILVQALKNTTIP